MVLLAAASPFWCLGPFCLLPLALRIYFLGVFVTSGSYFISVPLGNIEGGSRAGSLPGMSIS